LAGTRLTVAVLARDAKQVDNALREAAIDYQTAFGLRSTVRERESSLDHLTDLIGLVASDLAERLAGLRTDLLKQVGDESPAERDGGAPNSMKCLSCDT
jgi:hypothetical protein